MKLDFGDGFVTGTVVPHETHKQIIHYPKLSRGGLSRLLAESLPKINFKYGSETS